MEQVLTILGTIASLGAIPLSIYLYLKTKEAKLDKVRKEIVKTLSYQIGEERQITAFEIQTVINSKIRENRFKKNTINIDEIVEDLVSEIISSPMIDRNKKQIILADLKSIYIKDEILDNVKDEILDDIKEDNLTWDNLEHKIRDFDSKQELEERLSVEMKGKSYERISTWFAIIAGIITIILTVFSLIGKESFEILFEQISQNKGISSIVLGLAAGLIISSLTGLLMTLKKRIQRSDETKSADETKYTADTFFKTRKDIETFDDIVKSNPKNIKYSGGNMENLISNIMESECLKNYIINNIDVKVQFLFPDPNNKDVIENFVKNITIGNKIDIYKMGINNAVKRLDEFINKNNLQNRVEYRFYQFVPSFGLQIIAGGSNDRLYVDLYTYGIAKNDRYCFKIEKNNSSRTYEMFKEQYEKLWEISQNASR